jgi:hypothetical protein
MNLIWILEVFKQIQQFKEIEKGFPYPSLVAGPKSACGPVPQCAHSLPGPAGTVALAQLAWPGPALVGPRGHAPSSLITLWRTATRTHP